MILMVLEKNSTCFFNLLLGSRCAFRCPAPSSHNRCPHRQYPSTPECPKDKILTKFWKRDRNWNDFHGFEQNFADFLSENQNFENKKCTSKLTLLVLPEALALLKACFFFLDSCFNCLVTARMWRMNLVQKKIKSRFKSIYFVQEKKCFLDHNNFKTNFEF